MPDRSCLSCSKYSTCFQLFVNMVNYQAQPAIANHGSAQWRQMVEANIHPFEVYYVFLFLICCFITLHDANRYVLHTRS